jgi:hypothetical protein
MPRTPVKETRRPELRLPERRRDEILRALSEIRLPDVDWSKIDPSKLERPKFERPDIDLSRIDLPRVDVRRALEDAAVRAGVRQRTRSRWPIVVAVLIAAGVGLWAVLQRPTVRRQVEESARKARIRIEEMRDAREARDVTLDDIAVPVATDEMTESAETVVADTSASNGHAPVAVGPGPRFRLRRPKTVDAVAEAADAVDGIVEPAADAVAEETPALEEAASAS